MLYVFTTSRALLALRLITPTVLVLQCRILSRPLLGELLVSRAVRLVHVRDFRHQRIVGVWIRQERADTQQHFGDGQRWRPLLLENVQAN